MMRSARRLKVSGSGNAPDRIWANSSASIQSRNSAGRGQRNGSSSRYRSRLELGVGLAGEDFDVVPECGQFTGELTQVDALAAAVRLAAVGEQRDAERPIRAHHAGQPPRPPLAVR